MSGDLIQKPWKDELDYEHFYHRNVPCLVARMERGGNLNGYIVVGERHPWFKLESTESIATNVHNGITFSKRASDPTLGEFLILGFDTGLDYKPTLNLGDPTEYKTFAWVRAEVIKFANEARSVGYVKFVDHPLNTRFQFPASLT